MSLLREHRDLDAEIKITVSRPIRIVVLDQGVLELERLARKGTASVRAWANAGIAYLEKHNYQTIEHKPGPTDVDAMLVEFALSENAPTAIATIDRQLRAVLETFDIPTIWPKARHGLLIRSFRS